MGWADREREERRRSHSGTQLAAATDSGSSGLRLEATGLDLGGGACRHAVYELERRLQIVEADRPAREAHAHAAGSVSVVMEGHGGLEPASRSMSARLLDAVGRELAACLPVHDLRADARSQALLVRAIADGLSNAVATAHEGRVAEASHGSVAVLFLSPHFFWAARCGEGAIFLARAGSVEQLTGAPGGGDDSLVDVLGAPLVPGDTFLVSTRGVARALALEGIARPLRHVGPDGEALAAAARSLGDGAIAAGVREGALVLARG